MATFQLCGDHCRHTILIYGWVMLLVVSFGCERGNAVRTPIDDAAYEAAQTEELLGVSVQDFPLKQGVSRFDELRPDASDFRFAVSERAVSGPKPRPYFDRRRSVLAREREGGTVYEAFCGHNGAKEIAPGHEFVSTLENRRHRYGGSEYYPEDVFIGKRTAGKLEPVLFFRDVGSHNTAPHHMAIDSRGICHLAVADVVVEQNNRLHLYWAFGDLASGRWMSIWLIDRRGFTSTSRPWCGASGENVHLVWSWYRSNDRSGPAKGSGLFHVQRTPKGFGCKTRVVLGEVRQWDVAIDPTSGRMLIVYSRNEGVYVLSLPEVGGWTTVAPLHPGLSTSADVSIEASDEGSFVIRTGAEDTKEWVLRPK